MGGGERKGEQRAWEIACERKTGEGEWCISFQGQLVRTNFTSYLQLPIIKGQLTLQFQFSSTQNAYVEIFMRSCWKKVA